MLIATVLKISSNEKTKSVQSGIFVMGIPVYVETPGGFATICGVLFTITILLFGSGIPTAEGKNLERYYKTKESAALYTVSYEGMIM